MATITLTVDAETLDRLKNGEALVLTATLKEKKPRTAEPLPDHLKHAFQTLTEVYTRWQPTVSPALAWKTLKPLFTQRDDHAALLDSIGVALDWNHGRPYQPQWLLKDLAAWEERNRLDLFAFDEARERYRKSVGLS